MDNSCISISSVSSASVNNNDDVPLQEISKDDQDKFLETYERHDKEAKSLLRVASNEQLVNGFVPRSFDLYKNFIPLDKIDWHKEMLRHFIKNTFFFIMNILFQDYFLKVQENH